MITKDDMVAGQLVTYIGHNKLEEGVIKSVSDDKHVFVVYHCDNDWINYKYYTAARTEVKDLILGWR